MSLWKTFRLKLGGVVSSTRRAKQGKRDMKNVYRGFRHLYDDRKSINVAIDSRNAKAVRQEFMDFFVDHFALEKTLFTVTDSNQVIEYKIISKYTELFNYLDALVKNPVLNHQLDSKDLVAAIRKLHKAFAAAQKNTSKAKRGARHLKVGKETLADKKISSDEWLLRMGRIHGKHVRNAVKHQQHEESDLFKHVVAVNKFLKKELGNTAEVDAGVDKHQLKSLKKLINDLIDHIEKNAELIKEVFREIHELESDIVEMSKRLDKMEHKELERLHNLLLHGFPRMTVNEINQLAVAQDAQKHAEFTKSYNRAIKINRDNEALAKAA